MDTHRIEVSRVKVGYPQGGDQIELQVDARVERTATEVGKTPTSWLTMTKAQAAVLHSLLGDLLGR
jgi:hypothetical protein